MCLVTCNKPIKVPPLIPFKSHVRLYFAKMGSFSAEELDPHAQSERHNMMLCVVRRALAFTMLIIWNWESCFCCALGSTHLRCALCCFAFAFFSFREMLIYHFNYIMMPLLYWFYYWYCFYFCSVDILLFMMVWQHWSPTTIPRTPQIYVVFCI